MEHKNYYKQFDGVKYDREILEKAEEFARDGQISYADAVFSNPFGRRAPRPFSHCSSCSRVPS